MNNSENYKDDLISLILIKDEIDVKEEPSDSCLENNLQENEVYYDSVEHHETIFGSNSKIKDEVTEEEVKFFGLDDNLKVENFNEEIKNCDLKVLPMGGSDSDS